MHGSEIESLKADLRRMQARVNELETAGEEPTNRRNMLRGLGAAAAGAAVGGLAFARPAAADFALLAEGDNTVLQNTSIVAGAAYSPDRNFGLFHLTDDVTSTQSNSRTTALTIAATGNAALGAEAMVVGAKISGSETGMKLNGPVPLKLNSSAAPSQSSGTQGQFIHNGGDLWFCVSTSGSHRWRKLTGPAGAGGYYAVTPKRVYDSRAASPLQGTLATGANRLVSVADGRNNSGVVDIANLVPAGATAVTANVTVTGTIGGFGYLAINPGGNTVEGASTINWFGEGQSIANGVTLTLNDSRQVTVICNGGGSTHFIIDVSGYFL
ncbi:MAG: hypothetical protein K8R99_05300 [Actinomycetia bacterium]|nr:hypothetical protein [Actinomycetes bacterium]